MGINGLRNPSIVELLGKDSVNTRGVVGFFFVTWENGCVNSHLQELIVKDYQQYIHTFRKCLQYG
jgi:hypothetical protein